MELDVLKIYAGSYVSELDIDLEDKLTLINFIKEADEYDIMAVLTDGELPDEWDEDYLAHLEGQMEVLDEQIYAMENVLTEATGDKLKKAMGAAGSAARKGGGYAKKAYGATASGAKKAAGATASGAKKAYGGTKKGAMAAGKWAKEHPKTAIGAGLGLGALGAAAAYRARKKRKAAQAEKEG